MSDKDGRNTQKNHVSDSGVVPRSSHQVSLKTRYCGHLYSSLIRKWTWWIIGTRFPYIRRGEDGPSPQCNIHLHFASSSPLSALKLALNSITLLCSIPSTKGEHTIPACCAMCCATGYGPCHRGCSCCRFGGNTVIDGEHTLGTPCNGALCS